ncbi:uncharacterized protein TNCV_1803331 [Trichonephila clavipes]|uniref:Transmembrane protein n=1 Tax=Trichonephila clavipes TaxID=2585209 RepID=A0A8X6VCM8_TRICX|nr:uncharacterized protein TNCV_1803331 [Trichonephila clavipes]
MLPVLGKKAVLEWCMEEGLIGSSYVCRNVEKVWERKNGFDLILILSTFLIFSLPTVSSLETLFKKGRTIIFLWFWWYFEIFPTMSLFNCLDSSHVFSDLVSGGDGDLSILRSSRKTYSKVKESCDSGNEKYFCKSTTNTKNIASSSLSCENDFIDKNIGEIVESGTSPPNFEKSPIWRVFACCVLELQPYHNTQRRARNSRFRKENH